MEKCNDIKLSMFNRYIDKSGNLYVYNINNKAAIIIENTRGDIFRNNFRERIDLDEMLELGIAVDYNEILENKNSHKSIINDTNNMMIQII